MMPNLLKQLELDELSLVDRPANKQAMVSLYKRDNSEGETMENEVEKMSDDMKAKLKPYMDKGMSEDEAMKMYNMDMKKEYQGPLDEVDTLNAELDLAKAEIDRLSKSLEEAGYIVKSDSIEKSVEPEYLTYGDEQINKSDIPAPILKALEEAELAKADAELVKKAEAELPHFDIDVAKSLVAKFEDEETIMQALKAADAVFGQNMAEVGKSDAEGEFTTASDKLDALVKSYMDTNKMKKSEHALAYAAVAKTDEGKALITKSYKGE
tara:strand:+ start:4500 stop:5300 length:801 start_codon:yes stop_codon:yes gene_type:complete